MAADPAARFFDPMHNEDRPIRPQPEILRDSAIEARGQAQLVCWNSNAVEWPFRPPHSQAVAQAREAWPFEGQRISANPLTELCLPRRRSNQRELQQARNAYCRTPMIAY